MDNLKHIVIGVFVACIVVYVLERDAAHGIWNHFFNSTSIETASNDQRGIYQFHLEQCRFVNSEIYKTFIECLVE